MAAERGARLDVTAVKRRCIGRVVGRVDLVEDRRHTKPAPGLVDCEVQPRGWMLIGPERSRRVGAARDNVGRQVGDALGTPLVGTDVERHAIAELPGIRDLVGAVGASIANGLGLMEGPEAVCSRRAGHVAERFGMAEGETRPLDESARRVDRDRTLIEVVDMHGNIGAKCAVGGLRAAVEVEVRATPCRVRVHRAILRASVASIVMWLPVAGMVPAIVGLHIAADLKTDIAAWNVVEARTIEVTDPHVLDRLGFDRKIGSLCSRNRDKPCRGAEKKTLRYLHSNLQFELEGPHPPGAGINPTGSFPRSRSMWVRLQALILNVNLI